MVSEAIANFRYKKFCPMKHSWDGCQTERIAGPSIKIKEIRRAESYIQTSSIVTERDRQVTIDRIRVLSRART
jgi:hypothetical protein